MRLSFGALLVFGMLMGSCRQPEPPLPDLGEIPRLALTGSDGRTVQLGGAQPEPRLYAFFFTRCPSVCPRLVARMKEMDRALADEELKAQFVLVSVDAENDTPAVLKAYAEGQALVGRPFQLVTGPDEAVKKAAETGFHVAVEGKFNAAAEGSGITHGSHIAVADRTGRMRAFIRTFDDDAVAQAVSLVRRLSQ